jgi:hypothetical protein
MDGSRNDGHWENVLCEGVAVDAAHGNAEGTRLQDVVVGEALDQL